MNWKNWSRRIWLNVIGVVILAAGLASAAVIYQGAGNSEQIMFGDSRMYRHNLELLGGKFMVMIDDFRLWFLGLWQGKSLAVIIGVTAIIIALGFFYAAKRAVQPGESEEPQENYPDGTG